MPPAGHRDGVHRARIQLRTGDSQVASSANSTRHRAPFISNEALLGLVNRMNATRSLLLASLILCLGSPCARSADTEHESVAIVELGGATTWDLKGGGSSFGPDLAVEVTPVESWLELEAGTTPFLRPHSTEWDTDLLFKKPWTLSEKVEFMAGAGPEWIHTSAYGVIASSFGVETVLDFMF